MTLLSVVSSAEKCFATQTTLNVVFALFAQLRSLISLHMKVVSLHHKPCVAVTFVMHLIISMHPIILWNCERVKIHTTLLVFMVSRLIVVPPTIKSVVLIFN